MVKPSWSVLIADLGDVETDAYELGELLMASAALAQDEPARQTELVEFGWPSDSSGDRAEKQEPVGRSAGPPLLIAEDTQDVVETFF